MKFHARPDGNTLFTFGEQVDKFTIALIRYEKGCGPYPSEEAQWHSTAKTECQPLYKINSLMWELEDRVGQAQSLDEIGIICLALRCLTLRRSEEMNRLSGITNKQEKHYK